MKSGSLWVRKRESGEEDEGSCEGDDEPDAGEAGMGQAGNLFGVRDHERVEVTYDMERELR
jgi:hypothetical protein